MAALSLRNVVKRYGSGPSASAVIHGVNAEITDGEFIVIVGPSGCGKSTLLRMVAGLEEISDGEIAIGDVRRDAVDHLVDTFAGAVLLDDVSQLNGGHGGVRKRMVSV